MALGTIAKIGTILAEIGTSGHMAVARCAKHVLTPFFHCICIINILLYYYIAVLFTVAIHEPTENLPSPCSSSASMALVMPTSRPIHITIHPLALLLSPIQL